MHIRFNLYINYIISEKTVITEAVSEGRDIDVSYDGTYLHTTTPLGHALATFLHLELILEKYIEDHSKVFIRSERYGTPILPLLSEGNDATVEETFGRLQECIEVKH